MKKTILGIACVLVIGLGAFLSAQAQSGPVKVRLRLLAADTGKDVPGIVRLLTEDGKPVPLAGLYERMNGLSKQELALGWHVVPAGGAALSVEKGKYRVQAVQGVESALAERDLDLSQSPPAEIVIKLDYVFRPESRQLVVGNTHLHLKGSTLDQSDEYLRQIPSADGLQVLFISYLERFKDDALYITNKYPIGDLPKFNATGVLVNNGEEHRHNFLSYGEGYGHVMFLNIKELVQPVSSGPGISGAGFDDVPLRPGIDSARKQGGTIIWCHNTNGFEDVLNALTGRLDALNVFDGSRTGKFEENYYRYLNLGIRLPISTGTDWFMYDFSRVYAKVPGKLTIPAWLDAVKAGRCQASNGPVLSMKVNDKEMGDTIALTKPGTVSIEADALGRHDFQTLQLIHNGRVIKSQPSTGKAPFAAKLVHEVRVDTPGWFAVRIDSQTKNELDRTLYAHGSPVYVELAGKKIFDVESAQALLKQIEEGREAIAARGKFSSPAAADRLLALYDEAAKELRARVNRN